MTTGPVLHIFNPETDFALGSEGENFTPKANIVALRRRLALLPSLWAKDGDAILLLDPPQNAALPVSNGKGIDLLMLNELRGREFAAVRPWGWNATLRRLLLQSGVSEELLPTSAQLEGLRHIAHRRTTIPFHEAVGTPKEMRPQEMTDAEDIMDWAANHPGGYLKAPWSSSGRGVRRALSSEKTTLRRWLIGTLRRQGSVMAEPDWQQSFDFATEWLMQDGTARFLGYSLFEVDAHRQYRANATLAQAEIETLLRSHGWSDKAVSLQKAALERIIAPHYSGPLGIDALFSPSFGFNLCVEINPRMTMGVVNLLKNREIQPI